MGFLNRSAKLYVAIGRKQTTVKITMKIHEDSESVPDDLILVSHDDVILAIGHNVKPGTTGTGL